MVIMGIDPGLRKSCGWVVLEVPLGRPVPRLLAYGVEDQRCGQRVLASFLRSVAKKYSVTSILIEDFQFLKNNAPEKASQFVVGRMKFFIGYLAGFFSACYFPVKIVAPNWWHSRIANLIGSCESSNEVFLEIWPSLKELPKSYRVHVFSALGIALAEAVETLVCPLTLPKFNKN